MDFVFKTDVGQKRKNNEDCVYAKNITEDISLFIVADGLGGYECGEVASRILVDVVSGYIEENSKRLIKCNYEKVRDIINCSIDIANKKIYDLEKTDEKYKSMGTTIVLVLKIKSDIYYISIGDSRLYYICKKLDEIQQITIDDTYVNELIRTNVITEQEAINHPQKHVLTKAIGILKNISGNVKILEKSEGYLLLCSDGVTNMITNDEILEIFKKVNFEDTTEKIIQIANENGGVDNITAIVIKL